MSFEAVNPATFAEKQEPTKRLSYTEGQTRAAQYKGVDFTKIPYVALWNVNAADLKPVQTPVGFFRATEAIDKSRVKPKFLERTDVEYAHTTLETFNKRGYGSELLNSLLSGLPEGAVIAGGFAHSVVAGTKDATDIDIFFTSSEAFGKTLDAFVRAEELDQDAWAFRGYVIDPSVSVEKLTLNGGADLRFIKLIPVAHDRPPIQLVKLTWYDSADHVIDSFDLTLAQVAFENPNKVTYNPFAFLDISRKHLTLHRMQFPASTLRRVIKYTQKGYYACPGALVEIAEQTRLTLNEDPELNGQVVYVD